MLYAISWFFVFALLAIWSVCIWVLHSFTVWSLTGIGAMAGQSAEIERLPVPGWLAVWIPPDLLLAFKSGVAALLPWLESILAALPSLAGWLAPLAWILWIFGFIVLAICALALHALISLASRKLAPAAAQ